MQTSTGCPPNLASYNAAIKKAVKAAEIPDAWRLYNVSSAAGDWTSRLDGTQHFNTTSNTVAFRGTDVFLGKSQGGGHYIDGDVAELILYDHVLASGDRDTVEAYIADKYGLPIA